METKQVEIWFPWTQLVISSQYGMQHGFKACAVKLGLNQDFLKHFMSQEAKPIMTESADDIKC